MCLLMHTNQAKQTCVAQPQASYTRVNFTGYELWSCVEADETLKGLRRETSGRAFRCKQLKKSIRLVESGDLKNKQESA